MNNQYLPTEYQNFIYTSRYARWLWDENRRETWPETVKRYFDFFQTHLKENCKYDLSPRDRKWLEDAVLTLKVMPSMRCLMTAGTALERENVCAYNCSYTAIDNPRAFDEILYILMNGTGVGYSVETRYVNQLPVVAEDFHTTDTTIVVADSKLGWARSLKEIIHLLYGGQIPQWDTSKLRVAGAPLKTFGGRASGPGPLEDLFKFVVKTFQNAAGRKLTTLEVHDIVCKIAEIVVVGGVRRSALICLSDLNDDLMRDAKSGRWWENHAQRALANISYVVENKPDVGVFMKEWLSLYNSKSGERGIFSRAAARKQAAKNGRRDPNQEFGTNPCSEIILRNKQFCNLSEVVARPDDTPETLKEKIEIATIFGTWQSTLTDFKYLSRKWKENCEEERLLGVSITGIFDCSFLTETAFGGLEQFKDHAIKINKKWAKDLGINQSVAITCVKPSGTVSQLVDSASGMHPRHSPFYIRTVRADNKDPLCKFMKEAGFPWEPEVNKPEYTSVFSFPIVAPKSGVFRDNLTALDHLTLWKAFQDNWCEHKPSVTINVRPEEWVEVAAWVWNNFDSISGISFLPYSDSSYRQMPYQEITEKEYKEWLGKMPKNVDWEKLANYEATDMTLGAQQFACSSSDGACEVVDLGS